MTPNRSNAALRTLRVVQTASTQRQVRGLEGWAEIFDLTHLAGAALEREVASRIGALHEQLDLIEAHLGSSGISADAYSAPLGKIRKALSLRLLSGNWKSVADTLDPSVVSVMILLAELMPDDGGYISPDELSSLKADLDRLSQRVHDSNLPEDLIGVLNSQIEIIQNAIQAYEVRGPDAFKDASLSAALVWHANRDIVNEHADASEVKEVKSLWSRIAKQGKRIALINTVLLGSLTTMEKAVDLAVEVAGYLTADSGEPKAPESDEALEPGV